MRLGQREDLAVIPGAQPRFYHNMTTGILQDVPNCVGWHWFKYADDSADWHKGIVGPEGNLHRTLVEGMAPMNRRVYTLRGLR